MKKFIVGVVFLCSLVTAVHAQITPGHIERALQKNLQHPYLFFNEQEKSVILERIEHEPEHLQVYRSRSAD